MAVQLIYWTIIAGINQPPFILMSISRRSDQEIAANWFVVVAEHLVDTIVSTGVTESNPEATSDHVVACFRKLRRQACTFRLDPVCRIEVWQGEGPPMRERDSKEWEVEEWFCEELEPAENPGVFTEFYQPKGPRRLHISDGDTWHILDIDTGGEDWFRLGCGGEQIIKSLRWLIQYVEQTKKTSDASLTTNKVDFWLLAEDLCELDQALRDWNGAPDNQDCREMLEPILQRLCTRLCHGNLNLVGLSGSDRELLSEVRQQVEWVQRLFESGHVRFEKYLPYPTNRIDYRLAFYTEVARVVALTDRQVDVTPGSKPKQSGEAGLRLSISHRIVTKVFDDKSLVQQPARWWAAELDCAESTVKESPAWKKVIMTMRESCKSDLTRVSRGQAEDEGLSVVPA